MKKTLSLVIASAVTCAVLLFAGIVLLEQYSPALASSLNALVAGTNAQGSPGGQAAAADVPISAGRSQSEMKPEVSSLPASGLNFPAGSDQSQPDSGNSAAATAPDVTATIAQLFNNPAQFHNLLISLSGIVTSLGNDRILLNDGTGQILVEVEDDLVNIAAINGLTITVLGTLNELSGTGALVLDACTINGQDGAVVLDDCRDDGIGDDDDIVDEDDDQDDDDDGIGDDDDDDLDDDEIGDDDDGQNDDDDDGQDDDDNSNDNDNDDDDDNDHDDDDDHGSNDDDNNNDDDTGAEVEQHEDDD